MYLKSIRGDVLFEGTSLSLKRDLETAVNKGVCLDFIDLRGINLSNLCLDGAQMKGACFWGANLSNTDMSQGDFSHSDFRTASFSNSCLAESDFNSCDFSGSYFSQTIITGALLEKTLFSCPSIFSLALSEVKSLSGALYNHQGEVECDLSSAPLVIQGFEKQLVFMKDSILIGADLKKNSAKPLIKTILLQELKKMNCILQ